MEQTLGHVTHYQNLRGAIDSAPHIATSWFPLPFEATGLTAMLPLVKSNWSARASWQAWQALQFGRGANRYDAVFFHTQVTTLLSTRLMRRVPAVISLDATPLNYDAVGAAYGHHTGSGRVEAVKRALNRRALHAAMALITWCDWARTSLVNDYGVDPDRISVIAPGVNLAQWPGPQPRQDAGAPVRFLFVGADFPRKGGDVLLEAFRGLEGACELHVVTKAQVKLEPGISVYTNVTPNSDLLRRLYAKADVFVLPTHADCFPVAVQEAMAAGLPVIASDVGAIGEAVIPAETGMLVPPGDPAALREALLAMAHDLPARRAMGARARRIAELKYDSAANAHRILDIMLHLVES
ncbi:MAG TPA: glycosyltransferase family 4 protein [Chloroflexota bacterium]|nr:glycosyltransferase family 4 protein [Chloroflexota bacterium]